MPRQPRKANPTSRNPYQAPAADDLRDAPADPAATSPPRRSMFIVLLFLSLVAALSLLAFSYQTLAHVAVMIQIGRAYLPYNPLALIGHLVRGVGCGMMAWHLAHLSGVIRSATGDIPRRHAAFWRTTAWMVIALMIFAAIYLAEQIWPVFFHFER